MNWTTCNKCSRRESFVGQFDALPDGTYMCLSCADKAEKDQVARRLARQADWHKRSNLTHVRHGATFKCSCGEFGTIDFDFVETDERRSFANSIIWRTDGTWECSKCLNRGN